MIRPVSGMKINKQWLKSILGYALYTLFMTWVMVWLLFPAEFARQWIADFLAERTPAFSIEIKEVNLHFPYNLVLSGVTLKSAGSDKTIGVVPKIIIKPNLRSLLSSSPAFQVTADLYQGKFDGVVWLENNSQIPSFSGEIEGLDIGLMKELQSLLERDVQGILSLTFERTTASIEMQLELANGLLAFRQEMFGHKVISHVSLSMNVSGEPGQPFLLSNGNLKSGLFDALFEGSIELRDTVENSVLQVAGELIPRPEFFAYITNKDELAAFRKQLGDKGLSVNVYGQIKAPQIRFKDFTPVISPVPATN